MYVCMCVNIFFKFPFVLNSREIFEFQIMRYSQCVGFPYAQGKNKIKCQTFLSFHYMVLTFLSHYVYLQHLNESKILKELPPILQYICKSIKKSQIMLLLFCREPVFPSSQERCSPQLPGEQRTAVTSRSRLGISALTSSGQCLPPAEPTPQWAAPLTRQELGLPQGVKGTKKHTQSLDTWLQSPHSAASWLCDLGKPLHLSEPPFLGL